MKTVIRSYVSSDKFAYRGGTNTSLLALIKSQHVWLKSLDTGEADCATVFAFDFSNIRPSIQLKVHSQLWDYADLTILLPVWKAFTSTLNQIYASDPSRNPLQSYLMFHLIFDLLLKISFWANFYSSCYNILSYLVKNSIQRNMNRRGEKRVGAGREKSLSFNKITREMNQ